MLTFFWGKGSVHSGGVEGGHSPATFRSRRPSGKLFRPSVIFFSLHHSCSSPAPLLLRRLLIKLGLATRRVLPVQPKRPRWVQGKRRRLVLSVFLCDVFQLFLVDVNVVFGGQRLTAQAASVRLHVRVTRGNRHLSRRAADRFNFSPSPVWSSEIKTPG